MAFHSESVQQAASSSATTNRRTFLSALLKSSALIAVAPQLGAGAFAESAPLPAVVVYKDPSCGCCKEWVKHMQKAGFAVTVHDTPDMDGLKASVGLPKTLASCHTAMIGTYLIEGHVPADLVQKFLAEKSTARGLAVPGMVSGSPGMEGGTKEKYDVLVFETSGKARVYASR